jgi:hypothetical protein
MIALSWSIRPEHCASRASHKRFLPLEQRWRSKIDHARFSLIGAPACSRNTLSEWRAIMSSSSVGIT